MDLGVSSKEVKIAALDVRLGFGLSGGSVEERSNQAQWVPVSHLGMKLWGREESEESWEEAVS